MRRESIEQRVAIVESTVERLSELPVRVDALTEQVSAVTGRVEILTERVDDVRRDLTAFRGEFLQFTDETRGEFSAVREEMTTGFASVRQEMTTGFAAVRQEMTALRQELGAAIDTGDQETRRYMRVLYEDLRDQIKTLGEGLTPRRRKPRDVQGCDS